MRKVLTTLCLAVLSLVVFGLVSVASASSVRAATLRGAANYFTVRQLIWSLMGAVGAIVASRVDYHIWRRRDMQILLGAAIVLALSLVLIPGIGEKINGSRRWIRLPYFSLQPSEFAKLGVVILLSAWMDAIGWRAKQFVKGFLVPCVGLAIVLGLLMLEPDFGATFVTAAIAGSLLFVAGTRLIYLISVSFAGLAGFAFMIMRDPVRMERIHAWTSGPDGGSRAAHHVKQSILAFVNGGVSGVGLNNCIQKHFYLPEAHTDFIFAIAGEEFGLVGTLGVVLLFVTVLVCGIWISMQSCDRLGRLIAFGLTMLLVFQATLNIGVVIGALPTKGLALPFISYGGTNMLAAMVAIGVLVNIGRHAEETELDAHAQLVRNAAQRI